MKTLKNLDQNQTDSNFFTAPVGGVGSMWLARLSNVVCSYANVPEPAGRPILEPIVTSVSEELWDEVEHKQKSPLGRLMWLVF